MVKNQQTVGGTRLWAQVLNLELIIIGLLWGQVFGNCSRRRLKRPKIKGSECLKSRDVVSNTPPLRTLRGQVLNLE